MATRSHPSLIIVGASARAAAQSARRAGYEPWCIDLFADRDLQQIATAIRCPPDAYPQGIVSLVARATFPPEVPVLYTGALENHPEVLEAIALQQPLLGCSAEVVRKVRDPSALASIPPIKGLGSCRIHLSPPQKPSSDAGEVRYLIKPRHSAGGHGIRHWSAGDPFGKTCYLQEYAPGTSISATYVADAIGAVLLGVTEQMLGDAAFGSSGFRYCGSLGSLPLTDRQRGALEYLGMTLARRFGLHGPFGVDAVLDARGDVRPVEVNPRYTASMELLERATDVCVLGEPSSPAANTIRGEPRTHGKAVVFATREVEAPDLYQHFSPDTIADVPAPGQWIHRGQPICTFLSTGIDRAETLSRLHETAAMLDARLRV